MCTYCCYTWYRSKHSVVTTQAGSSRFWRKRARNRDNQKAALFLFPTAATEHSTFRKPTRDSLAVPKTEQRRGGTAALDVHQNTGYIAADKTADTRNIIPGTWEYCFDSSLNTSIYCTSLKVYWYTRYMCLLFCARNACLFVICFCIISWNNRNPPAPSRRACICLCPSAFE